MKAYIKADTPSTSKLIAHGYRKTWIGQGIYNSCVKTKIQVNRIIYFRLVAVVDISF
ncbi:hypothetical protein YC2023_117513 [Brassica napus]